MTTYSKLKDGSWGLRGPDLVPGTAVTVTTKSGEEKVETVGKVLWQGDGVVLATIADGEKPVVAAPAPSKAKAAKAAPKPVSDVERLAIASAIDAAIELLKSVRPKL